ncbi:MAG: hypothetical protein OK438_03190 [Thaumarchaeota archaeon]|nr:hypothetical protein [Nitrososphaerota archaeon]
MNSAIEDTVKALAEFESELDRAKAEASESKKKMLKDASVWAESAKAAAISRAQQMASETMARAMSEAEKEAEEIRKEGESSLKAFESSISRRKTKAAEAVVARLLGESK